jgi:hypothetical protein
MTFLTAIASAEMAYSDFNGNYCHRIVEITFKSAKLEFSERSPMRSSDEIKRTILAFWIVGSCKSKRTGAHVTYSAKVGICPFLERGDVPRFFCSFLLDYLAQRFDKLLGFAYRAVTHEQALVISAQS